MAEDPNKGADYALECAELRRLETAAMEHAAKYRRMANEYAALASGREDAAARYRGTAQLLRSLQNGDAKIVCVSRAEPGG